MDRWIALDGWGVIYREPRYVQRLLTPFLHAHGCAASAEQIYELYLGVSLGVSSPDHFWRGAGLEERAAELEEEFVRTQPRLGVGAIETLAALRRTYKVGLLSNDVAAWAARIRDQLGMREAFDAVVISSDVGARKPDERIYRAFLERANVRAEQCIFVDDRAENLAAAAEIGFHTIHLLADGGAAYEDASAVVRELRELPAAAAGVFGSARATR
jgi:HAD superfamily hydrolase (TIGR01509 family)